MVSRYSSRTTESRQQIAIFAAQAPAHKRMECIHRIPLAALGQLRRFRNIDFARAPEPVEQRQLLQRQNAVAAFFLHQQAHEPQIRFGAAQGEGDAGVAVRFVARRRTPAAILFADHGVYAPRSAFDDASAFEGVGESPPRLSRMARR